MGQIKSKNTEKKNHGFQTIISLKKHFKHHNATNNKKQCLSTSINQS